MKLRAGCEQFSVIGIKQYGETYKANLVPLSIAWEDGSEYEIDRILNVCRAASLKADGVGIRYTVRIGSTETYLFLEENKWFVERR